MTVENKNEIFLKKTSMDPGLRRDEVSFYYLKTTKKLQSFSLKIKYSCLFVSIRGFFKNPYNINRLHGQAVQ